ncbi:MAG: hypothetical protein KDA21_07235, partial [Phycisphaerales bacterium]|nr:hypothetical protein [Phycisphaerales bacterium]
IKGAGGSSHLELLRDIGGNAFRTWGADQLAATRVRDDGVERSLIDEADRLGLGVAAGFWMEHPRKGFDYADPAQVRSQLNELAEFVRTYKDHPAILVWGIGNEVEIGADPAVTLRAMNDAAKLVKSIDPTHAVMTVVAEIGDDKAELFMKLCPDIDILGINSYGGMASLAQRLATQGYDGPYLVTEYGLPGHWETGGTAWGAPWEPSSADKATFLRRNYEATIDGDPRCLGGFAFLWGWKQERTSTWYGMWLKSGEALASVDTLAELWTGKPRENRAPPVSTPRFDIPFDSAAPDQPFKARVDLNDPDGDPLEVTWVIREETTDHRMGGDAEAAARELEHLTATTEHGAASLRTPTTPGNYRLFVFVRDGQGNAATSNLPFRVVDGEKDG